MTPVTLETERLLLRPWRDGDRAPFAALNADAESMRHFPAVLSRAESDAFVDSLMARFAEHGWSQFAVERKADGAFLGLVGPNRPLWSAHFTPCVELGWRILRAHEGHGYATEAARAALAFAFDALGEARVYAFTVPANAKSQAVMQRIGMTRVAGGDFDHPRLPEGHPLRRHVLYAADAAGRRPGPR
jgi:RimJ/RimL family protein N-acetyltransferase